MGHIQVKSPGPLVCGGVPGQQEPTMTSAWRGPARGPFQAVNLNDLEVPAQSVLVFHDFIRASTSSNIIHFFAGC